MKAQNLLFVARFLCSRSSLLFVLLILASSFQYVVNEDEVTDNCLSLILAAENEDMGMVKSLLKTVNPNCSYERNNGPRTALVAAAQKGNLQIVDLLIASGAKIKKHAKGDETPLMAASSSGNLEIVKMFVMSGADVNKKVHGDGTALISAARNGHEKVIKYLIGQGGKVDTVVPGDGTALIAAAAGGHFEACKMLLENGADPAKSAPGDENPLYHAYNSGEKTLVDLLSSYLEN